MDNRTITSRISNVSGSAVSGLYRPSDWLTTSDTYLKLFCESNNND